jgi:hypothetical protein
MNGTDPGCGCDEIKFVQWVVQTSTYNYWLWGPVQSNTGQQFDTIPPFPLGSFYYPKQTPWERGVNSTAEMWDLPGTNDEGTPGAYSFLKQSFQTAVLCTKGKDAGQFYGNLYWGQSLNFDKLRAIRWVDGITKSTYLGDSSDKTASVFFNNLPAQ